MTSRHLGLGAALLLVLPALLPAAEGLELPDFSEDELAASIHPMTATTTDLARVVSPLESVGKKDGATVVTMQSDILFDFAKSELTGTAVQRIGELVAQVPQGAAVTVGGHTDSIGDDASNATLSQQRADAVAAAVRAARPDLQLTVRGFGESQPVASNETADGQDDPAGRAANRRVEVSYQG